MCCVPPTPGLIIACPSFLSNHRGVTVPTADHSGCVAGWVVARWPLLGGWVVGWAGWVAGWLAGWLSGWLARSLASSLDGGLVDAGW